MAQGSSGSGGIPGGPLGPILVALFGLGAAGAIIWTVTRGGGGKDDPTVVQPTLPPTMASPSEVPLTPQPTAAIGDHGPANIDKAALREGYDDAAVVVFTMYGMPPQVGLEADDPDDIITQRFEVQCLPDVTFPGPCVQYYILRRGASVRIIGGDSRAGFWPALEYVRGGGCDIEGDGRDISCPITIFQDTDVVAVYYGGESPGLLHYTYPQCPTQRGDNPPTWTARCP